MRKQRTIKDSISYSGIGLHTGRPTTVIFHPAEADTGIAFVRSDVPNSEPIPADISNVVDVTRDTTLGHNGLRVITVEHVLAAVAGLEIDNLVVEVDSNEPPVGDGSSLPFVKTLLEAGILEQDAEKAFIEIQEPVTFSNREHSVTILPSSDFRISYTLDYSQFQHPNLSVQQRSFVIDREVFEKELAPARTFCFLHEVEYLQAKGLIKGGSLENAVVIGPGSILNDGLRFEDEFVRHKMLDIVGDLSLLGVGIHGHVVAHKSGHMANIELAQKIREMAPQWDQVAAPHAKAAFQRDEVRSLDINEIKKILPHRYPFLFVDRITELRPGHYAIGIKNVSINEPFFQGHWPDHPVLPGVIELEAMAQVGGVLMLSREDLKNKWPYFMAMERVRFRRIVSPGDQLVIECRLIRLRSRTGKLRGKITVDGAVVAEAELHFFIGEREIARPEL